MLVSLNEILCEAEEKKIAIGGFNTPTSECLLAILDAAEEVDLPVIIMHAQCHENVAPLDKIGRLMVELAKHAKTKACVHLDHGEDFAYCKKAIDLGFTSVMIDASVMPYEENRATTALVSEYAHEHGVNVEAELGSLPSREGGSGNGSGCYTDPSLVPDFLEKTKVDALAIAFGTAHGIYKEKPILNTDVITEVRKRTNIPLVMHGGSGISQEEYREVIARGIRKINYYTYMSYSGYAAAKDMIEKQPTGFYHDLALAAQKEMQKNVASVMRIFSGR